MRCECVDGVGTPCVRDAATTCQGCEEEVCFECRVYCHRHCPPMPGEVGVATHRTMLVPVDDPEPAHA